MLHNPDAFNAQVLAGDIRRYREQGMSLDTIYQGAMDSSIPFPMWQEAVRLYDTRKKLIIETERKRKLRLKKTVLFFGVMILVGMFFTFLIFQNIDSIKSLRVTSIPETNPEVVLVVDTPKQQRVETISVPTTPTDSRFNAQVKTGDLELDFFGAGVDQKIFRSIFNADSFFSQMLGVYSIKSIKIAFDKNGDPVLNHFELQNENGLPYFLLSNTLSPFQFQNSTAFFHQNRVSDTLEKQLEYNSQDWEIFLDKIAFQDQVKGALSFSAEILVKNEKPHFRVVYDYPDNTKDSLLEVEFMPFTKGNGQRGIAFDREPNISTGFLGRKYPIRRRPVRRSSN